MTTPIKLRQKFLSEIAEFILEEYSRSARGVDEFSSSSSVAREEIWDIAKQLILEASDPTPLAKLTDGDITQRVDAVLEEVATGDLTPAEGKKLIGLLQAGFDITELPALIERLNELDKKP